MKRAIVTGFMLVFVTGYVRGQSSAPSTLNSTGGSKIVGTSTYEWSVGEMTLVNTASASNIIVTQGLLQPMPVQPAGISKTNILGKLLQVYPNPASDVVYLQYDFPGSGKLNYVLQDITGKQISNNSVVTKAGQGKQQVNLAGLAAASYMLNIIYQPDNNGTESISFKIDKIN